MSVQVTYAIMSISQHIKNKDSENEDHNNKNETKDHNNVDSTIKCDS